MNVSKFGTRLAGVGGIVRNEFGVAVKIGSTPNHIHALPSWRTTVLIAEGMQKWRSLSSRRAHKTFPEAREFRWQTGRGAFSVSQWMSGRVMGYVENQREHHRRQTFEEEFIAFLERHRVEYDPEYAWD